MTNLTQIKANRLLIMLACLLAACLTSCTPKDWYLGEWQGTYMNKFDLKRDNDVRWTLNIKPDNTCHITIERNYIMYQFDCKWEPESRNIIKITDDSKNIRVYPNGANVYRDNMVVYLNTKGELGWSLDDIKGTGLQMEKISK